MYAAWSGSSWNIQAVDTQIWVGMGSCLALDGVANPHISYYRTPAPDDPVPKPRQLKYATWNGTGWDIVVVDDLVEVEFYPPGQTSLALDGSGRPHIAYCDPASLSEEGPLSSRALKYAVWNGTSWDQQIVDDVGDVGQYCSMALDGDGHPHISYRDYTNRRLKYATWNGIAWVRQVVDNSWKVGEYTSLALDANGYPHISYYRWVADALGDLKHAKWDGITWQVETVDTGGNVGRGPSLALDGSGHPHISYWDATNGALKYATTRAPAQASHVLPSAGYYMVSFPFTPTSDTPHALLSDDLGNGGYFMWGWGSGSYTTIPTSTPGSQTTNLDPQRGYWLLAPAATLDIDVGGTLPYGNQSILLQPGWNMIAVPYQATMDSLLVNNAGDVRTLAQAQAAGWILATFYTSHDGTGSYTTVTIGQAPAHTLSYWRGYWVLAGINSSLVVPPPAVGGGSSANAGRQASAASGWSFDIHAVGQHSADTITVAGAEGASDGFDGLGLDRPKAPAAPGPGRLRMVLTPRKTGAVGDAVGRSELAVDTRGAGEETSVWEFSVGGGAEGEPVVLSWPQLSRLPRDRVAILQDLDTGIGTFMRSRSRCEFQTSPGGAPRRFAVTVKPAQAMGTIITSFAAVPLRGGLGAQLVFSLSQEASIEINVMNVAGRLVQRVQSSGLAGPGTHAVSWNGRSLGDSVVPNGVYLCALTARTEDGQQTRRVVPVAVSR